MKKLLTAILLLLSLSLSAQMQYFTTNGKNRLSRATTDRMLARQVEKFSDILGVPMYGSLTVESNTLINDSLITLVSFDISDLKPELKVKYALITELTGRKFPDFELKEIGGDTIRLAQLLGKPVLINIWFTACAPCIEEMPALNKMQEKYGDEVHFVAITFEEDFVVNSFLQRHDFNFTHLVNAGEFINSIGVKSAPVSLFIDKNGILRYVKGSVPYEENEEGELVPGQGEVFYEIIEELLL